MVKTRHDGDCTIYSSPANKNPWDGICTCGYGLQLLRKEDSSEMCSRELRERLENERSKLAGKLRGSRNG
jgi:hypothetical protein